MKTGMHIVIEGQDATGKDTQAKLLAEYLRGQGRKVVHYAESGTASKDSFVAKIAKLNYGTKQDIDHRTRVLLFLVNRYEQWRKLAEPALRNGDVVITTRSWYSTLIYEGYVGGVSRSLIRRVHKEIMPEVYFRPDKIVFMTISDEAQAKRLGTQTEEAKAEAEKLAGEEGTTWERKGEVFKSQGDSMQHKLNQAYLKVAKEDKIPTLDASGTIEEVQEALRKLFEV